MMDGPNSEPVDNICRAWRDVSRGANLKHSRARRKKLPGIRYS